MAWDYTEIDPFHRDGGHLGGAHAAGSSSRSATALRQRNTCPRSSSGNAQELPFADGEFDAVIVDPPYYDAFQYGDLSDFFYVWLKRSVGHLYPELFATPLTPKRQEIIESRADKKSPEYISHDEFETRLQNALREMARVVKRTASWRSCSRTPTSKRGSGCCGHCRRRGSSFRRPGRCDRSCANRPTAQISAALDSSVVLVCRPAQAGRDRLLRRRRARSRGARSPSASTPSNTWV